MQCNLCSDENIPLKAFDVIRIIYKKSMTSCCICFLDRGQSLINARKHYHLPSWTFFASGEESISTRYSNRFDYFYNKYTYMLVFFLFAKFEKYDAITYMFIND